ncbi:MAG: hypothetical protein ACREJO_04920 [Phycisphaerales bacterium]
MVRATQNFQGRKGPRVGVDAADELVHGGAFLHQAVVGFGEALFAVGAGAAFGDPEPADEARGAGLGDEGDEFGFVHGKSFVVCCSFLVLVVPTDRLFAWSSRHFN